jgi:chemotaxis protein MotB
MLRVVGLSSAIMLDSKDPYSPINRRISLIVLNKETEDAISSGGKPLEVSGQEQVTPALQQMGPKDKTSEVEGKNQ